MKIGLDPGHGGAKPGAVYSGLLEKNVTLAVALIVREKLEGEVEVVMTREDDSDISLQGRCDIANNAKCDIFVSLHCNAKPAGSTAIAKGEEIWFKNGSDKAQALAEAMTEWVDAIFPDEPFRGIKGTDDLYVLNRTKMPAILIEMGFIDNSVTNRKFKDPQVLQDIGLTISSGIIAYSKEGGE